MNDAEFERWFGFHASRFTSIGAWLANLAKGVKHRGAVSVDDVLAAWRDTLSDVALEDAMRATRSLAAGDEEFPEKGCDCHPTTVRRLARRSSLERVERRNAGRFHDGEPTYLCAECRDSGWVTVWHPSLVAFVRANGAGVIGQKPFWTDTPALREAMRSGQVYLSAVASCSCDAARRRKHQPQPPTFAESLFCRHDPENLGALIDFALHVRPRFEDFSEQFA